MLLCLALMPWCSGQVGSDNGTQPAATQAAAAPPRPLTLPAALGSMASAPAPSQPAPSAATRAQPAAAKATASAAPPRKQPAAAATGPATQQQRPAASTQVAADPLITKYNAQPKLYHHSDNMGINNCKLVVRRPERWEEGGGWVRATAARAGTQGRHGLRALIGTLLSVGWRCMLGWCTYVVWWCGQRMLSPRSRRGLVAVGLALATTGAVMGWVAMACRDP